MDESEKPSRSEHRHTPPAPIPFREVTLCQVSAGPRPQIKGNALPDKLHRAICTAPLASAGCTNCIPCLEERPRKASGLASTREQQRPACRHEGILGEPQVHRMAAALHIGVAL